MQTGDADAKVTFIKDQLHKKLNLHPLKKFHPSLNGSNTCDDVNVGIIMSDVCERSEREATCAYNIL
jgi:hypothetical protein